MRRTIRRVLGASVVAAVFVAGGVVLAQRAPEAHPHLPRVSPAALLASTVRAMVAGHPIAGSVSATVDLGLPDIVDVGSLGPGAGVLSLLTGTHTLKLWRSTDGFRISVIEPAAERALFLFHGHAWAWDFDSLTAYELGTLPPVAGFLFGALGGGGPGAQVILRRGLTSISDTTRVFVAGTTSLAGRPAYQLIVSPRQRGTLIGAVEIDIDSVTRLPLGLALYPRGETAAAISLRFTSVSFAPIDPSTFQFRTPPGIRVVRAGSSVAGGGGLLGGLQGVRTFGRAWNAVAALRVPRLPRTAFGGLLAGSSLRLGGPLFSVRVADRGDHSWVAFGAVPMSRLDAVERRLR